MKTSWSLRTLKTTSWNGDHRVGAVAPGSHLRELSSVSRAPPALGRGGAVHLVRVMVIQSVD